MEFTIDTYEPPFLLEFSGSGRGFGMEMTIGIAGTGDGSRVTFDMRIAPHGLLRLLQPVMRRQYAGVLAAAKHTLDGGATRLATGEAGA
jgi:hypothetical protein